MPSEYSPADQSSRATYPEHKDRHGEDPARWLDRPLPEIPDQDEVVMAYDRIASIDSIGVVNAWRQVERDLGRGGDDGAREHVMRRLDECLQELIQFGERPSDAELAAVRERVRAEHPEWDETEEIERPSRPVPRGPTPGTDRYQRESESAGKSEASGPDDFAVAADGGDDGE